MEVNGFDVFLRAETCTGASERQKVWGEQEGQDHCKPTFQIPLSDMHQRPGQKRNRAHFLGLPEEWVLL